MSGRRRGVVACLATALLLAPLLWLWATSFLPGEYSAMDMGYVDDGGGPALPTQDGEAVAVGHAGLHAEARSVVDLVSDADRPADVEVRLVADKQEFRLESGREVDGYTLNGESPGPVIRAVQGELVEVQLVNESVPDGVTLHWHGLDVPNAMDGVAGVTQDAVRMGEEFTYRFVADQVGTYWYHSHQISHEQVKRGLLGGLVISAKDQDPDVADVPALVHVYDGVRTINGVEGDLAVDAAAGQRVRVRVTNTDNGPMPLWVGGAPYRVLAVDGTDLNEPTPVEDEAFLLTGGARADLEIVMPADSSGVRVEMGGNAAVVLGTDASDVPEAEKPETFLDLLRYGSPAPLGFDPASATREFEYVMGRRPGFVDGRPGLFWTINGKLYPDVPMYTVTEGDVVRMRIENNSGQVHPMHLHGHHVVVLSRDGEPATGSPWWVDSLNVEDGETYEVAFVADNPGVWMDHCHNLPHAAEGLIAHLMYAGVTTPFRMGHDTHNEPE